MFGIDSAEILIIAVVALVVIGPKDLPRVMRTIGNFVGRARGMARHFRSGFDAMMREAELEEMEKKWRADNERIMRDHPQPPAAAPAASTESDWGKPLPAESEPARPAHPPIAGALPGGAPLAPPAGNAPPIPPPGSAPTPPGEPS
jgi:sec-independent protein translocase protein TatB